MAHFASPAHLEAALRRGPLPSHVGPTVLVDQKRIDRFADATGDRQWIHVNPARAASSSFGATVAHGYLTLSLLPPLLAGALDVDGCEMQLNYGLDRVRFLSPVLVGSHLTAVTTVRSASWTESGLRVSLTSTVSVVGAPGPALAAEAIVLLVPATS